ncbi:sensor histidine kinase [Terrabacter ginsenosidimutans]|uniref:sensor histidine kinase n=1 Tax=Terrabacter ginsenosidimutans TaxID=490575 RepID=UPI0031E7EB96
MESSTRRRWPRAGPRLTDAVVAVALLVVLVLSFGASVRAGQRPMDIWAWVLALMLTLPYAVHRRFPWAALAVVLTALLAWSLLHYAAYPGVSVFVLLFGLALHGRRRDSLLALGASGAALAVALAAQPVGVVTANDVISTFLATAVAWLAGDNLRQRRLRWSAMEERARLLEREREDRARAAVAAERLRIARELHDIVAHSMSVVAVQAGVGRHVIDTDVAAAGQALGVIEATSRDALVEMRRMLGVLRRGDEAAATRPMPGLADLPALVAETRAAGLGVTLEWSGDVADVPAGVSLAAYRVVQESLTNVIKHGGPVAHVRVSCGEHEVELEVTDDGRRQQEHAASSRGSSAGHGLVGMRERVELYGGSFHAAPRPGGGYGVQARLPYAAGSS